jgi:hypothetical protein
MKNRGKNPRPRNIKACHNITIALLVNIAEMGTQSTLKSIKKTLHEVSLQISPKTPKRNKTSLTNVAYGHNYKNVAYGHNYKNAKNESQKHPCQESDELPPK